jgi:phosphate uptake regulator
MLSETMRAYTERDSEIATHVIDQDDEVDKLYNRGIEALQEEMQEDAGLVRAGTIMLFVLAALERVGDRAQNIAWHTKEMLGAA